MPDRDEAEHREVCKWVLDELIGTSSQREFTVEYGDWNGEYVRRSFGFQLLAERQAPDGSVYLRATDAAINVLVGALDTELGTPPRGDRLSGLDLAVGVVVGAHAPTATLCSKRMESRTIPQRELRNNVAEVLRRAEAGTEFTITVRGRPVARLGPPDRSRERRRDVDRETLRAILAATPVDDGFAADIASMRDAEASVGDPWEHH